MKIDSGDLQSKLHIYQTRHVQAKQPEAASAEKTKSPTSLEDYVAFSERGRAIADAQRAIASVPDVREPLVAQIQTDLQQGTYVVDSQRAAEGILRESMLNQAAMA
jgi:flagellar biosynthesis anti-sigma factor FlgM